MSNIAQALIAGGVLVLVVVLLVGIPFTASLGPHCRCGHHRSVHRMSDTGCVGMWRTGENALGYPQREFCSCQSYRPTEVGYWDRVRHGTEERAR